MSRDSYTEFRIQKANGGYRTVSAPFAELATKQTRLLRLLEARLEPSRWCHGFRSGRSIVTNARPHVGAAVVIRIDLDSFFHTVGINRVYRMIREAGYGRRKAKSMSLLSTRSIIRSRVLPQGSPCSPYLSNLSCRTLDRRISILARRLGYRFTRYADDITLSSGSTDRIGEMLSRSIHAIVQCGFRVNKAKTAVMYGRNRQWVTGLVVNQKVNTSRKFRRNLRAMIHQQGMTAQTEGMLAHQKQCQK